MRGGSDFCLLKAATPHRINDVGCNFHQPQLLGYTVMMPQRISCLHISSLALVILLALRLYCVIEGQEITLISAVRADDRAPFKIEQSAVVEPLAVQQMKSGTIITSLLLASLPSPLSSESETQRQCLGPRFGGGFFFLLFFRSILIRFNDIFFSQPEVCAAWRFPGQDGLALVL